MDGSFGAARLPDALPSKTCMALVSAHVPPHGKSRVYPAPPGTCTAQPVYRAVADRIVAGITGASETSLIRKPS
jgi:hypothetical protein